jgi:hypothetical protein
MKKPLKGFEYYVVRRSRPRRDLKLPNILIAVDLSYSCGKVRRSPPGFETFGVLSAFDPNNRLQCEKDPIGI